MNPLTLTLLLISLVSMGVYFVALINLVAVPHRRGIVRTAACRVTASFGYVMISVATIAHNPISGYISIGVFVLVQFMWQANSITDVLSARKEAR